MAAKFTSNEEKQLINLHFTGGQVCVWHPEEVDILRRKHHIVGSLIGALPGAPRQNSQLGLPLQLMPEEAAVLLQHGVARFVTMSVALPSPQQVTEFKQGRKDSIITQKALWIEHQAELREQLRDVIEEGKKRKKEKKEKKMMKGAPKNSKTEKNKEKEDHEVENAEGDCKQDRAGEENLVEEKRECELGKVDEDSTNEGKEDREVETANRDGLKRENVYCELEMAKGNEMITSEVDDSKADRLNKGEEEREDLERLQGKLKERSECSSRLAENDNGNEESNKAKTTTGSKRESVQGRNTVRIKNGTAHEKMEGVAKVRGKGSSERQSPLEEKIHHDVTNPVLQNQEEGETIKHDSATSQVQSLTKEETVLHNKPSIAHSPRVHEEEDDVAMMDVTDVPPILDSDCLVDVGENDGELDKDKENQEEDKEEDGKETAVQDDNDEADVKESGCCVQLFTAEPLNSDVILEAPKSAWHYPSNEREELRSRVFLHFWEMGYFITSGTKFGGDFLVYPGDPYLFHSYFIVVCVPYHKQLTTLDLVSHGRLGTFVKKTVVLCSLDSEKCVVSTSMQWSGIS